MTDYYLGSYSTFLQYINPIVAVLTSFMSIWQADSVLTAITAVRECCLLVCELHFILLLCPPTDRWAGLSRLVHATVTSYGYCDVMVMSWYGDAWWNLSKFGLLFGFLISLQLDQGRRRGEGRTGRPFFGVSGGPRMESGSVHG